LSAVDERWLVFALASASIVALAFVARIGVHFRATPGGVDTWYYLASAAALRRRKRFPISLPQYLLQDRTESYPPGFVLLLVLLPESVLRRGFWLIAPAVDATHMLLLMLMTFRLSDSLVAATIAGLVYALAPQLIAETRSLNPRAPAVLLASIAMLLTFRALLPPGGRGSGSSVKARRYRGAAALDTASRARRGTTGFIRIRAGRSRLQGGLRGRRLDDAGVFQGALDARCMGPRDANWR
jgi:hypothetical protein